MKTEAVINEVNEVIKGKKGIIEKVLLTVLAEGHILLEDIPGVGKTTLALAFSKALGLEFSRIQFTPDVTASDIVGFTYFDKVTNEFKYYKGAVMSHFVLGDEINRTSSRTQSALLEVMEECAVTVDGVRYETPKPFTVIATQNPLGHAGTQTLPQAQLDRFMIKLSLGYPDFASQVELLKDRQTEQPLDLVRQILEPDELLQMQKEVREQQIADSLLAYITQLTIATREHEHIVQGVSPRGALAICRAAKAYVYIKNRHYVIPEDIMAVFIDVTSHRIIIKQSSEKTAEKILQEVLQYTDSPDLAVQ